MSMENSWEEFKSNYCFKTTCNYVRVVKLMSRIDSAESYPLLKIPLRLKTLIEKKFSCAQVTSENFFTFPTILQRAEHLNISDRKYEIIRRPIEPQRPERSMADSYKRIYVNTSRRKRRISFNCLYFVTIPLLMYFLFPPAWFLIYLMVILLPPTSLMYFLIMRLRFFEDISISGSIRLSQDEIKSKQKILDEEYQNKLIDFENAKKMYEKDLFKYRMNQGKISKEIEPYLDTILFGLQHNFHIASTEHIQSSENPKRGVLESFFYKRLYKKFPSYVKKDIKVGQYFPDIALIIENVCYIDIEIDEPYSFDDQLPIHYIGSSDVGRDVFFEQAGWYVVRFSEIQIKNEGEDCMALIDNLVNFLLHNNVVYLTNVSIIQRKLESKKWTYDEAEKMIQRNWRKTYL